MEYKKTLNLPQTDFPMKADLIAREPQRLEQWQETGLYERIQARRAGAPRFVLHDGPPFANGDVHIGTALNKILKDIIVKYKALRGYRAPYVPGWDCHGLPIEFKVSQEMRKQGQTDAGPGAIRTACEAYARKYIELQRGQFKRLGVLGDWDKPYLTLDKEYEAEELRLFADIVDKGFVYRGKKPVYWSIPCRTALAEAEVEYKDHVSQSVYVKFPIVDQPGTSLVIWTTTPWTLPANLAVAYHSGMSYSLVRVGEEALIVGTLLLPALAEKCGWTYEIVRSLEGSQLRDLEYRHPFCQRTGRLYAGDNFVTSDAGTGFVHIAPGHGMDDYLLGLEHGLPIYSPVDDEGRLAHTNDLPVERQMPAEMTGQSILEKHGQSEANTAVLHALRVGHALVHQENYHHSYPHCWRSKTPVIFRAMDQWFIKIDHVVDETKRSLGGQIRDGQSLATPTPTFRREAEKAIEQVTWIPGWGMNRIKGAVESRPDWCISRQRTWGVPLPAFYDAQGEPILDASLVRHTADLVGRHGSNVWFEKSAEELWKQVRPDDWRGPEAVAKSQDTLDVWIDSGSSSRSVLMKRRELLPEESETADPSSGASWVADVYLEGSDQHRGWFQSSLLLSLAGNGAPPFRTVLTHGFMVDADREKISKSKQGQGGYEKPQTSEAYINQWGADIVRLWVASQDYRNDIIVSEQRIRKVAETYRLLRNTLRYQLSNLYDFDPLKHLVPDQKLTALDRWILAEVAKLEQAVLEAYDAYEFHTVYQKVSQFAAVELSAVYHDAVKDRLYTDRPDSLRRRATQTALHRIFHRLSRMLAPILAFTADEAWEFFPHADEESSVHLLDWQPHPFALPEAESSVWEELFRLREGALAELERVRQAKTIGKALDARLIVEGPPEVCAVLQGREDVFRELLNISQLDIRVTSGAADTGSATFRAEKAEGEKCERCWHWETDVGDHADHPTLCGRCVGAVSGSS